MKLHGTHPLHRALEARYGEAHPYPAANGRRAAWPCPACGPGDERRHNLTVPLDTCGGPPSCSRGCAEPAIWRALDCAPSVDRESRSGQVGSDGLSLSDALPHSDGLSLSDGLPVSEVPSLDRLAADRDAVSAMARVLGGGGVALGRNFACPLPGHTGHASLYFDKKTRSWKLRCWCADQDETWWTLGEVRACVAYGVERRPSKLELATWHLRLGWEAGLIEPHPVPLPPLPAGPPHLARVARGFALLVGLRWLRFPDQAVGFARDFAAAWCGPGISPKQAYEAHGLMKHAGVVTYAGRHPGDFRLKLWLPGSVHRPQEAS